MVDPRPPVFAVVTMSLLSVVGCHHAADSTPPTPVVWGSPTSSTQVVPTPPASASEPSSPAATPPPADTPEFPPNIATAATRLSEAANGETVAWDRLAYLCDTFGHRLSGSKALERAIDWAVETMQGDGLTNPRREKVMVPKWVRGTERARVLSPAKRELNILGLGGTVGTPGVRGEVAVVSSLKEIAARGDELKGKIVLVNQALPQYDRAHHESGYGDTVEIRYGAAPEGAKVGAKAVLVRSITAHSLQSPHTGGMDYEDGVKRIPAAAISVEDAEYLARSVARGPVRVELKLGARTLPDVESANAIAEIPGRERPEEIVLISGHIDSWDVGQGAHDDGSGTLMAMEAARLLTSLQLIPRRTIRVVLFTNEENGLRGAKAYFEAHKQERHVAAMEADSGSGPPEGFGVAGSPEQVAELARYADLFSEIGASDIRKGWGGADISPLTKAGVLSVSVAPDASHYFDFHHSLADTVDKVDPRDLQRNAAAMALMAYVLAERE
ncbi:MAG: M20/M25/M40 family metallo-hydrolase [Myxococcales bacterium FL481]|nr:MAG: M20/M25/M40 family metallo-hydrolase [Myxococcales bacterium FL481]